MLNLNSYISNECDGTLHLTESSTSQVSVVHRTCVRLHASFFHFKYFPFFHQPSFTPISDVYSLQSCMESITHVLYIPLALLGVKEKPSMYCTILTCIGRNVSGSTTYFNFEFMYYHFHLVQFIFLIFWSAVAMFRVTILHVIG